METSVEVLIERVLADKAAQRIEAKAKAWPEKIATIERLRDATRVARASMRQRRESTASPGGR